MRHIALFDLDGTLTDPAEGIINAVQFTLEHYGIHNVPRSSLLYFIGPPLAESFAEYLHCDAAAAQKAVEVYRVYFSDKGIFENTLLPGAVEMVQAVRAAGYETAIASSKPEVFVRRIAEHFGIADLFDCITGSCLDGSLVKKDEVITETLRRMQATAQDDVIMIGDREHDIHGAHKCGYPAVGVLCGYGDRAELEKANAEYIAADCAQAAARLIARLAE